MDKLPYKSAYTLVELMFAISILSIVAASFGSSLVACLKLYRGAVAQSELALRGRELRDKLLFHIRRPSSTVVYDGLLSAYAPTIDGVAFTYSGIQIPFTAVPLTYTAQSHRLLLESSNESIYPVDDQAPHDDSNFAWLRPGGLFFSNDMTWNSFLNSRDRTSSNRIYLRISLSATAPDGQNLGTRNECAIVPIPGKYQLNTSTLPDDLF